jgi:signal transduction histidine kinase
VEPVDRRALESERLDAIAQMVRGLAHESRNSLQKAVANLDLLELDLLRNAEHMQLTQRIRKSLSDLLEHYDEVRRYAEPVRIRPERVQLLQLCQLAFDEIAVQHDVFPHQLNVMSRAMHEDEIHVDREKVKLAFHHILENAIDAADDSARIDVSCSRVGARGIDSVNVTLHDHGCGFDEFSLKRAFEPFYTTKQRGTGLGLAICRRIVEAHGGSMMAANHPERGAVVLLSLPDQYSTPS